MTQQHEKCPHGVDCDDICDACDLIREAAPELLAELKRLYEAARTMADPEHCLHATREYLPWRTLADKARAAIAKAESWGIY
jgi:hypothetical protein